ncbi:hypothetical protein LXL04_002807 [Taraxacum kok-saghyz]
MNEGLNSIRLHPLSSTSPVLHSGTEPPMGHSGPRRTLNILKKNLSIVICEKPSLPSSSIGICEKPSLQPPSLPSSSIQAAAIQASIAPAFIAQAFKLQASIAQASIAPAFKLQAAAIQASIAPASIAPIFIDSSFRLHRFSGFKLHRFCFRLHRCIDSASGFIDSASGFKLPLLRFRLHRFSGIQQKPTRNPPPLQRREFPFSYTTRYSPHPSITPSKKTFTPVTVCWFEMVTRAVW